MQKITMSMINKRALDILVECTDSIKYNALYNQTLKSYSYENARKVLESWNQLHGDPVVCAHKCMAFFEYCIDSEPSTSRIKTLAEILSEGALKKVRDGNQMRAYVKRKISRFKTKLSTKINNKTDDNKNAVNTTIEKFNDQIKKTTGNNIASAQTKPANDAKKDKAAMEAFIYLENVLDQMAVCDTILNNQNKLSNRFNISNMLSESSDIESFIFDFCECVDTYRMDTKYKYNVALQNIPYTLYKNGVMAEASEIVEKVTDYFLLSNQDPDISSMKNVLEHNMTFLYDKKDIEGLSYMFKDIAKLDIKFDDTMTLIHEVDTAKLVKSIGTSKDKIKDILDDFKKSASKTPDKLHSAISRIYTQPADEIIEEYPDILAIIRQSILLVSAGSINPLLAIATLCVDYAIKLHMSRKQIDKYIDKQKKEIEKVDKKIEKAKTDEAKENLSKYKKTLTTGLDKLKDYRDKLYTEKDAEAIRDKEMDDEIDFDDDDDIDFDFNFDETASIIENISYMMDTINSTVDVKTLARKITESSAVCSSEFLDAIIEYFNNFMDEKSWDILISEGLSPVYHLMLSESTSNLHGTDLGSYWYRRDILKDALNTIHESDSSRSFGTLGEESARLSNIISGYNMIMECMNNQPELQSIVITEGSIKETIKLAGINLKNAIRGLSDKEKAMSQSIDAGMNTFSRSLERALTNDNREAVMRGSLIPSASKVIKGAIVVGAAWAIDPALAVIGALGALGVSKSLQAKERQAILDEIEIELKMTEKYLRIAEDNNDMKATRQLLKTQRDLQRQQQRIKYRMKVYNNQTTAIGPARGKEEDYDD